MKDMSIKLPLAGQNLTYTLNPSKIIALGLNYREHVRESVFLNSNNLPQELPSEPILFAKTPNVLIQDGEDIVIPAFINTDYDFDDIRIDYEAELAVVIKDRCKDVSVADALSHVLGYTCMNDVSMRNFQVSDKSGWFRGKSLDTFGPVGPCLVPAENILDPQNLNIRCRLNGKVVQDSNTSYMIFSIADTIVYISKQITLEAGDIIMTGTPSGVGKIRHGDIVEVEIEGVGILRNRVIEERFQY